MFLKRAGWSLWRHKFRNILILLAFAAILAVTLTSFMIYAGTSRQVEVTQKAVANAVTLTGSTLDFMGNFDTSDVTWFTADRFRKGPHVERYNLVMNKVDMEARGVTPSGLSDHDADLYKRYCDKVDSLSAKYISEVNSWQFGALNGHIQQPEKYRHDYTIDGDFNVHYDIYNGDYTPEENARFMEDYTIMLDRTLGGEPVPSGFRITAVSDSEYYDCFSNEGFALVEGRHFKSEEEDKPYVLISRAVAEKSGVGVGDTITLSFDIYIREEATFYRNDPWEVTILGLFDPPERDYLGDIGYQEAAQNMIFVPYQATFDYLSYLYKGESLLWIPKTNRATVYIDKPENVQEFVDFVYSSFNIIEKDAKTGRPVGTSIEKLQEEQTFADADPDRQDKAFVALSEGTWHYESWYTLTIDRGWYEMVAMPLENLNDLSLFMGVGLLGGAFSALLLVCVLNVRGRKREVGVLLSMGETKGKIFLQMFIEQAVPLILAAAIGFGAGAPLADRMGNDMLKSRSDRINAAYEQDKQEYLEAQLGGGAMTLETSMTTRSAANVASPIKMSFTLDGALAWGYFAMAFIMLFLTVLIQMVFLLRLSPAKIMTRRN